MDRRIKRLSVLLCVMLLIAAGIYIAGRLGAIGESAMMLGLLPVMLAILCLTCVIYALGGTDEKRHR